MELQETHENISPQNLFQLIINSPPPTLALRCVSSYIIPVPGYFLSATCLLAPRSFWNQLRYSRSLQISASCFSWSDETCHLLMHLHVNCWPPCLSTKCSFLLSCCCSPNALFSWVAPQHGQLTSPESLSGQARDLP